MSALVSKLVKKNPLLNKTRLHLTSHTHAWCVSALNEERANEILLRLAASAKRLSSFKETYTKALASLFSRLEVNHQEYLDGQISKDSCIIASSSFSSVEEYAFKVFHIRALTFFKLFCLSLFIPDGCGIDFANRKVTGAVTIFNNCLGEGVDLPVKVAMRAAVHMVRALNRGSRYESFVSFGHFPVADAKRETRLFMPISPDSITFVAQRFMSKWGKQTESSAELAKLFCTNIDKILYSKYHTIYGELGIINLENTHREKSYGKLREFEETIRNCSWVDHAGFNAAESIEDVERCIDDDEDRFFPVCTELSSKDAKTFGVQSYISLSDWLDMFPASESHPVKKAVELALCAVYNYERGLLTSNFLEIKELDAEALKVAEKTAPEEELSEEELAFCEHLLSSFTTRRISLDSEYKKIVSAGIELCDKPSESDSNQLQTLKAILSMVCDAFNGNGDVARIDFLLDRFMRAQKAHCFGAFLDTLYIPMTKF